MASRTSLNARHGLLWLSFLVAFAAQAVAAPIGSFYLMAASGTLTEQAVTVLWAQQTGTEKAVYEISLNGKVVVSTSKTNYPLGQLAPATTYTIRLGLKQQKDQATGSTLTFKTAAKGKVYSVLDYGTKSDTAVVNTKAIQAAITACAAGGTVYIPKGTFVSGALFLKSNTRLRIEGVLKGSRAPDDYLPMILNRFEGWELSTCASRLNAGTLDLGGHCDVVVSGSRAYVFYFTHPGRSKANPAPVNSIAAKRSVIQVAELEFKDGKLTCDRDKPTFGQLLKPKGM